MTAARVHLVDYGLGNLRSVANALTAAGGEVSVSSRPDDLLRADRVVLPGVGAFGDGMRALQVRELDAALCRFVDTGRPMLGICLGMQLLFSRSEEFGDHAGLGVIPGRVSLIHPAAPLKVPHVGWSRVHPAAGGSWQGTPLARLAPGTALYFVHSFGAVPEQPETRLAETSYGGEAITAAVRRGQLLGCQFHPEKSGPDGLALLSAFLRW